jgi:hypothetical protein
MYTWPSEYFGCTRLCNLDELVMYTLIRERYE